MKITSNRNDDNKKPIKASYDNGYTTDLSNFGIVQIEELRDIFTAWIDYGLPDDFEYDEVVPAFNANSGYVFLTNSEYQVAMLAEGRLESWYYTPYSGHEGFYENLLDEADDSWEYDDLEYLRGIAEMRGDSEGIEKLNQLLSESEE